MVMILLFDKFLGIC